MRDNHTALLYHTKFYFIRPSYLELWFERSSPMKVMSLRSERYWDLGVKRYPRELS
jgi:hypothetical protein